MVILYSFVGLPVGMSPLGERHSLGTMQAFGQAQADGQKDLRQAAGRLCPDGLQAAGRFEWDFSKER